MQKGIALSILALLLLPVLMVLAAQYAYLNANPLEAGHHGAAPPPCEALQERTSPLPSSVRTMPQRTPMAP